MKIEKLHQKLIYLPNIEEYVSRVDKLLNDYVLLQFKKAELIESGHLLYTSISDIGAIAEFSYTVKCTRRKLYRKMHMLTYNLISLLACYGALLSSPTISRCNAGKNLFKIEFLVRLAANVNGRLTEDEAELIANRLYKLTGYYVPFNYRDIMFDNWRSTSNYYDGREIVDKHLNMLARSKIISKNYYLHTYIDGKDNLCCSIDCRVRLRYNSNKNDYLTAKLVNQLYFSGLNLFCSIESINHNTEFNCCFTRIRHYHFVLKLESGP